MKQFEYKTISIKRLNDNNDINNYGSQGWEVITIITDSFNSGYKAILKREILEEKK